MPDPAADDLIRRGWEELAAARWADARDCFDHALEQGDESAEVLDGLGRALHFLGEYERAVELTERAFAAYRQLDMPVQAADRARWLAFLHGAVNSNMAVGGGWMARAESLLEEIDECAGHGWLVLDNAPFTDDAAERERLAVSALAIARRYGDTNLEYDALALLGEAYVATGRVAEGMKLLDEAMAAVSSGEVVEVVPVSDILCRLLGACEAALDVTRAEQWISVATDFEAWSDFVSPLCRSHYGGILVAVGRWEEAEQQLLAAAKTFETSYRGLRGMALLKLADLRTRQGRPEEARQLLEGVEFHPSARQTMAAMAFARGELALAEDLVRLCLDGDAALDRTCAPILEMLVQIRVARGDIAGATEASTELTDLAEGLDDRWVDALTQLARGRVSAADDQPGASSHFQAALRGFAELNLPLEAGRAQFGLARAIASESPDAAIAEARLALRAFERLGARGDADAAAAMLRELGQSGRAWPRGHGTLTKRETEVLSLLAEGCSNAEIAERLVISKRTAEHHVASILSKLDMRSRAEAAAYAVRASTEDT